MKRDPLLLALQGSPRKGSNTDRLVRRALEGAEKAGMSVEKVDVTDLRIEPCRGCLRCNVLGKCSNEKDDWQAFAGKWKAADGILIGSPVYFHSITGSLKVLIDRFRSFMRVTMREDHLEYDPLPYPPKRSAIILVQGEPLMDDYQGALDLLQFFLRKVCGREPVGHIIGTSLGVKGQIDYPLEKLRKLGGKMDWSGEHADHLLKSYRDMLDSAGEIGRKLAEACMEASD